ARWSCRACGSRDTLSALGTLCSSAPNAPCGSCRTSNALNALRASWPRRPDEQCKPLDCKARKAIANGHFICRETIVAGACGAGGTCRTGWSCCTTEWFSKGIYPIICEYNCRALVLLSV